MESTARRVAAPSTAWYCIHRSARGSHPPLRQRRRFLKAFAAARPGDVLVVDNAGRRDEACVGDLTVLEAQAASIAALVVWGVLACPTARSIRASLW